MNTTTKAWFTSRFTSITAALIMGCGVSDPDAEDTDDDREECRDDGDCRSDKECDEGRCVERPECATDADCGTNEECTGGECVEEPECEDDADCGADEECDDSRCVEKPGCEDDADCTDDDTCTEDVCRANGTCDNVFSDELCECADDGDCGAGEECDNGECVEEPECDGDEDCGADEECVDSECVEEPECETDANCAVSQECQSGDCVAVEECDTDSDCTEDEVCEDGRCRHRETEQEPDCQDPETVHGTLGFEDDLDGFEVEEYDANADCAVSRTTSDAYVDDASMRIVSEIDDPGNDSFWHCMAKLVASDVESGEVYRVRFWARTSSETRVDVLQVMSDSDWDTSCGTYNKIRLTDDWEEYEYIVRRPSCVGDGRVSMNAGLSDGTSYYDEVRIQHCTGN